MADIFISYSRKDLPRVRSLADALSRHGWSVWWDRQIPAGRTFDQVIAEALGGARCVVVVWSKESIGSSWVREEADEGRQRGILIPVLIDVDRPPLGFGRIQAIDLRDWDGVETADAFQKLITDITSILGPPQVPGTRTAVAPATIESQGNAVPSGMRDRDGLSWPAPLSVPGESSIDVATPPESGPQKQVEARSVRPDEWPQAHGFFGRQRKAVKWSLVAVSVLGLLAVTFYRLGPGGAVSSQPSARRTPSAESILRLNAVQPSISDS